MAYTFQQSLFPLALNLGATVAAGTAEVWGLGPCPSDIPTMHLIAANCTNGATLASDTTNYTTVNVRKGTTVMASVTNNGTGFTADTARSMTLATAVADRKATSSDSLNVNKAETGTGAAITAAASVLMWFRIGNEDLGAT